MYLIKVVEVNDNYIVGIIVANSKECYLNPAEIPVPLEVDDVFYHIEHRFYDIYDKNNQIKAGLVRLKDLKLNI